MQCFCGVAIVGPEERNKIAAALRDDVVGREDGPSEGEGDGEYEDEGEEVGASELHRRLGIRNSLKKEKKAFDNRRT